MRTYRPTLVAKGGAPLAAQPRPASPGRSLGRHGGRTPYRPVELLACACGCAGACAWRAHARWCPSPASRLPPSAQDAGICQLSQKCFEKRGIFGPQVRGNTAEFSENSDPIRSTNIAVELVPPVHGSTRSLLVLWTVQKCTSGD